MKRMVSVKTIVITGSSRGIGYHLAKAFLKENCQVMLTGRSLETLELAANQLRTSYPAAQLLTTVCDVSKFEQVNQLWKTAKDHFGKIDIWINNAGQGHPQANSWDHETDLIIGIVQTNILGVMMGSKVAMQGMLEQGFGAIYNMEGLGSDGRTVDGLAIYGTTKAAVRYFTQSLIKEAAGTKVLVGTLSPGMVMTEFITSQYIKDPKGWEKAKPVFNILADKPETVTNWMAPRILANKKHGKSIVWLTQEKVIARFVGSLFRKRNVTD